MSIFQNIITKKHITAESDKIKAAYGLFTAYFHNAKMQENLLEIKEEQFQEGFLRELFVKILGYTLYPDSNYNLITERKNEKDSKKADGAIIVNNEVIGVIELKDHKTIDLKQVETQAFGYKNNNRKASYVVTSNFEKLRFYIDNAIDFVEFNLFTLSYDEFALLWLCLAYENIAKGLPKQLKTESVNTENDITKELYKDYSEFKRALFADLVTNNPTYDQLTLFKKSQKLLDRLLFILFAEDSALLPSNSIKGTVDKWKAFNDDPMNDYQPLYYRFQKYFHLLNVGHKDSRVEVFAYNGGLFKPDDILDVVKISDEVLSNHTLKLADYNFASEVDVNILGHIFENSLTEIEVVTNSIATGEATPQTSKRKKDGVFYTPRYITTYIVENTLGKLCTDKKAELEIVESEYIVDKKRQKSTVKRLDEKLQYYRSWLLSLTICDPACGSGAFLNAALDFLMEEHKLIYTLNAKIHGDQFNVFEDIENAILEHNLFGVDINEESVEIAKLALWLRTAKPHRKLNSLNDNIKCGNSLISDPAVAGDKAFDWHKEFPQVFEKGGFDVVIGNPPYGAKIDESEKLFYKKEYSFVNAKTNDTYIFFTFKMLGLLKPNRFMGIIIPNTWLLINSAKEVREEMLKYELIELVDYGDDVFEDATVESITLILKNIKSEKDVFVKRQKGNLCTKSNLLRKNIWRKDDGCRILIDLTENIDNLITKIYSDVTIFNDYNEIIWGIKPYQVGHGEPKQTNEMLTKRIYHSKNQIDSKWKPLVVGSNVNRYFFDTSDVEYVLYGRNLMYPSNEEKINQPKLLIRQTSDILRVTYDDKNYYPQNSILIITSKDDTVFKLKFLMALLNSELLNFIYKTKNPQEGKTFAEIKPSVIKSLPIKKVSLTAQVPFITKADQMLTLNAALQTKRQCFIKRLVGNFEGIKITGALERFDTLDFTAFIKELAKQKFKLSLKQQDEWEEYFNDYYAKCTTLTDEITITDKIIDKMVYELYELTEEEIMIIEK